jgi:hypothetical protein
MDGMLLLSASSLHKGLCGVGYSIMDYVLVKKL